MKRIILLFASVCATINGMCQMNNRDLFIIVNQAGTLNSVSGQQVVINRRDFIDADFGNIGSAGFLQFINEIFHVVVTQGLIGADKTVSGFVLQDEKDAGCFLFFGNPNSLEGIRNIHSHGIDAQVLDRSRIFRSVFLNFFPAEFDRFISEGAAAAQQAQDG